MQPIGTVRTQDTRKGTRTLIEVVPCFGLQPQRFSCCGHKGTRTLYSFIEKMKSTYVGLEWELYKRVGRVLVPCAHVLKTLGIAAQQWTQALLESLCLVSTPLNCCHHLFHLDGWHAGFCTKNIIRVPPTQKGTGTRARQRGPHAGHDSLLGIFSESISKSAILFSSGVR